MAMVCPTDGKINTASIRSMTVPSANAATARAIPTMARAGIRTMTASPTRRNLPAARIRRSLTSLAEPPAREASGLAHSPIGITATCFLWTNTMKAAAKVPMSTAPMATTARATSWPSHSATGEMSVPVVMVGCTSASTSWILPSMRGRARWIPTSSSTPATRPQVNARCQTRSTSRRT